MRKLKICKKIGLVFALIALGLSIGCDDSNKNETPAQATPEPAVGESEIEFPKDHRLHNNVNEWYYFSGTVETSRGERFGLMFTIFQLLDGQGGFMYPSMMAISDPQTSTYPNGYKMLNVSPGETPDGLPLISSDDASIMWIRPDQLFFTAAMEDKDGTEISATLSMNLTKDILLHGEDGFIPMGDNIPSGYYSLTNLQPTSGIITVDDEQHDIVGGRMWMDHQWGDWTPEGYHWDWFAMRFDDGGSLMLFQFRDETQTPTIGNWTYRDGAGQVYYGTDFQVDARGMSGVYPIDWTIYLPSLDAEFEVTPLFDDQIFSGMPEWGWGTLWEGLCDVSGHVGVVQLTGEAFVELNDYE